MQPGPPTVEVCYTSQPMSGEEPQDLQPPLEEAWRVPLGNDSSQVTPAVMEDRVFLPVRSLEGSYRDVPGVLEVDIETGSVLRTHPTGKIPHPWIQVRDSHVYFSASSVEAPAKNRVASLDPRTGDIRNLASRAASFDPIVDGPRIILFSRSKSVIAVDRESVERVWTAATIEQIQQTGTLEGNALYVAASGTLYVLDPETGETLWAIPRPSPHTPDFSGPPVIGNGFVFYGRRHEEAPALVAVDIGSREVAWSLESRWSLNPVAVAGDRLYVTDAAATMRVYRIGDWELLGSVDFRSLQPGIFHLRHPPLVLQDQLLVHDDSHGHLWILSRDDGRVLWHRELKRSLCHPPVVHRGRVIFKSHQFLHAFKDSSSRSRDRW